MKAQDIRKKPDTDLTKMLTELRSAVRDLRFRIAGKEVKNTETLKQTRKDIARIMTVLRERARK